MSTLVSVFLAMGFETFGKCLFFFFFTFFKKWTIPCLFFFILSFQYTVDSEQMFNIKKFGQILDSNLGPLVSKATPLPTEPQPLPSSSSLLTSPVTHLKRDFCASVSPYNFFFLCSTIHQYPSFIEKRINTYLVPTYLPKFIWQFNLLTTPVVYHLSLFYQPSVSVFYRKFSAIPTLVDMPISLYTLFSCCILPTDASI